MKPNRVGVWQFEPLAGDPEGNLASLGAALESRDARDLDVLVVPEMFLTGWEPEVFADRTNADPSLVTKVGHHAKRARVAIASSVLTAQDGHLHNTFHLWDNRGAVIGTGHKIHLWGGEAERLSPGTTTTLVDAPFGRIGGVICYDVEFPEITRDLALRGAELFLVPAAFYSSNSWDLMTRTRALENGCFLAAANQIGGDPKDPHNGQSRIVDPFGNVLAEVPKKTTGIASATIDPTRITAARAWAPFLRDLRLRATPVPLAQ